MLSPCLIKHLVMQVEIQFHEFLVWQALDKLSCHLQAPSALPTENEISALVQYAGWMGRRAGLNAVGKKYFAGNRTAILQSSSPIAQSVHRLRA